MGDEMTTEDKLTLMSCQLLIQKAEVEKSILIAKAKLRQKNTKVAKTDLCKPVNRMRKRTILVRKSLTSRSGLCDYVRLTNELKKKDAKGFFNILHMAVKYTKRS
ncbi:hypothetical protein DPMN_034325 [Dreissena polymorpha]|uniref:Uncharacterized protein n=1 Tax=Dreissena polymorpha TaxID=45954 RepID=A0A9D4M7P1_DREPO|nr:hypothetical protein DPMN_034325 [Dreissena polymorpha]